ncbi:glycosyltransferase family 39 protein [Pantoea ananatis]|uniref:glycosyltransferase family 39 protein n=1 Tax=Pantoea ananas TaxID=553 RepID=UPI00287BCD7B|nr:glycosyltransferase family 39 protein [Pantoea ananatis]MDS7721615.1 glycosyltransferase family 39 protein [Pantoea ananatis]
MTYLNLILWSGLYVLIWSLVTIFLDPAVPYDAVEVLNWAQNNEWGSPKNPWLVGMAWRPALLLTAPALSIYWYITHFLAIGVGMTGCWFLAKYLSGNERLAWLALFTLNLSGIINFDIISYNDNYLLVMLWPWMMLFFFLALVRQPFWWIAFAITAGLASMAKYSTLAFVSAVFIATLIVPRLRVSYRQPVFYLAVVAYIAIISPNLLWLWQHDFAAFNWVDSQIKRDLNPWLFLKLLSIYYPLLILWLILRRSRIQLGWPVDYSKRILLCVVLLPQAAIGSWFLFHQGGRLTEWLQPFFILAPALFVACVKTPDAQPVRKAMFILSGTAVLVLAGYITVLLTNVGNAGKKMSGVIPFSLKAEKLWQDRYGTPLRLVGGEHLADWLTFYAPSNPETITPWDNRTKPNIYNAKITFSDIRQSGALLIGKSEKKCTYDSFSKALSQWPQMRLDAISSIYFSQDNGRENHNVCMGFVKPVPE